MFALDGNVRHVLREFCLLEAASYLIFNWLYKLFRSFNITVTVITVGFKDSNLTVCFRHAGEASRGLSSANGFGSRRFTRPYRYGLY